MKQKVPLRPPDFPCDEMPSILAQLTVCVRDSVVRAPLHLSLRSPYVRYAGVRADGDSSALAPEVTKFRQQTQEEVRHESFSHDKSHEDHQLMICCNHVRVEPCTQTMLGRFASNVQLVGREARRPWREKSDFGRKSLYQNREEISQLCGNRAASDSASRCGADF